MLCRLCKARIILDPRVTKFQFKNPQLCAVNLSFENQKKRAKTLDIVIGIAKTKTTKKHIV